MPAGKALAWKQHVESGLNFVRGGLYPPKPPLNWRKLADLRRGGTTVARVATADGHELENSRVLVVPRRECHGMRDTDRHAVQRCDQLVVAYVRGREELLEDNSIENLEHAQTLVTQWSRYYNDFHPHSSLSHPSPQQYAEQWKQESIVNTQTKRA